MLWHLIRILTYKKTCGTTIWPHPLSTEMPLHTDTCITIVTKSMNKFLKHYILFNTYVQWLHRVGCKYVMVFHRLFRDIRHQKKQNVLRNTQHNDCSLVYHTLLFEHYLFQWPLQHLLQLYKHCREASQWQCSIQFTICNIYCKTRLFLLN